MIILILISQITREEFLEFKKYVKVQFTKTENQIQNLNQRIEDLDKKLNKRIDDLITYLWIFMDLVYGIEEHI